ncbi:hypothetical protein [Thomasclavelia sp.]|uniref:hypothetical protein n=1 Tax=Thomasclavelia sp. TaxID=3025757 RepID=UPI0025DBF07C|nr:hypothetical protein [Thomasclavelia sp.]
MKKAFKKYNKFDLLYFLFVLILIIIAIKSLFTDDYKDGILLAIATLGITVLKKIK